MSMKYYAVTDDPNELLHYGVKGMKWGQHLFGDDLKPKSAGYKRALGKLRTAAKNRVTSVKSAVKQSSMQRSINRQAKQQANYNKAVQKAQQQAAQISALSKFNAEYKQANHNKAVQKAQQRAAKISELKKAKAVRKNEIRAAKREKSNEFENAKLQKQQDKYNKAVQKAQGRMEMINARRETNRVIDQERALNAQFALEQNRRKNAAKNIRKYAKNERRMDKYMQEAREGRLKYGKLSEEQVGRITDRLSLERSARALGNTEKPKFKIRMKEALQEGMLQGVTQGTAAAMKEVAVAKVQNRLANKKVLDTQATQRAERERVANRVRNKKTKKEIREDLIREADEAAIREGKEGKVVGWWNGTNTAAKKLKNIENNRLEEDRKRKLQARINDEMDMGNNANYQSFLTSQREKKRIQDVQDRLNSKRDEDFFNTYLNEKGYANEDDAVEAHRNKIYKNISDAIATSGRGSQAVADAIDKVNRFNNASREAQKRMMNAAAVKEKEERDKTKKAEEESKRRQDKIDDAKFKALTDAFKTKMKQYADQVTAHDKLIVDTKHSIRQLEKNKDQMDPVKYQNRMDKLNETLERLKKNPPIEPKFEDFFS